MLNVDLTKNRGSVILKECVCVCVCVCVGGCGCGCGSGCVHTCAGKEPVRKIHPWISPEVDPGTRTGGLFGSGSARDTQREAGKQHREGETINKE